MALTLWPGPAVAVAALALVGVGYGLVSGLTAAAVAVYWRRALYGRMASRVYIAWCAAAIVLPIIRQIKRAGATTLREIANALNERGVRTARGGQWHAMTVRNVLARA